MKRRSFFKTAMAGVVGFFFAGLLKPKEEKLLKDQHGEVFGPLPSVVNGKVFATGTVVTGIGSFYYDHIDNVMHVKTARGWEKCV